MRYVQKYNYGDASSVHWIVGWLGDLGNRRLADNNKLCIYKSNEWEGGLEKSIISLI